LTTAKSDPDLPAGVTVSIDANDSHVIDHVVERSRQRSTGQQAAADGDAGKAKSGAVGVPFANCGGTDEASSRWWWWLFRTDHLYKFYNTRRRRYFIGLSTLYKNDTTHAFCAATGSPDNAANAAVTR